MVKPVALLTDFGTKKGSHYIAAMKSVIHNISPKSMIFDISHDLTPYSIAEATFMVSYALHTMTEPTIIVAVIDPGVGTDRDIIALAFENGHIVIGPNNGIFSLPATVYQNEILDIWSGDIFHMTKPLQTGDMLFQLEDENGNIVLEFNVTQTQSVEDVIEDFDDYNVYDLITDENRHIYFSVDENKGGIFQFEIESDTLPIVEDFACASGNIETPDSEWDFIDGIYFRGEKLEPTDYLDNTGKAATVNLFEHEE